MMYKTILPTSWDFGVITSEMVKVASRGLAGHDYSVLVKRAGAEFANLAKNIKLASNQLPVHVIAMGATEGYGCNRNGDGFTAETLKKASQTFEKFARCYRHHKNKDSRKSYGQVKLAFYNEPMQRTELLLALNMDKAAADKYGGLVADLEMEKLARGEDLPVSMACGLAGTLVKTKRGFSKIEDIVPGSRVLTHSGRYQRVLAAATRKRRSYVRVHTQYCGRRMLEFTPDHEFFVARWQDIPPAKTRNKVKSKDRTGFSRNFRLRHRDELHLHARWLPCGYLRPGDLLLMPIYRGTGKSKLTKSDARVLGYYLAEGSKIAGTSYGIALTVNKADAVMAELPELAQEDNYHSYQHSASAEALNVCILSTRLYSKCLEQIGSGVRNKVIPAEVYDATDDLKLEFLSAWFNGDGWQDNKGLHWSTCSESLSIELQMLLASVGIPASVYRIDHPERSLGEAILPPGVEYTINVSNRFSAPFAKRSKAKTLATKAAKTTAFITGNYLAIPVASVETVNADVAVYDLQVAADESFTANGFAVHNCKISHDVCNFCGNKAPTRAQYCKSAAEGGTCTGFGCANGLTKVAANGKIQYVDNPNPTFFDISSVFRPADRTAYGNVATYMQKAASTCLGSAELAELIGVSASFDLALSDLGSDKHARQIKLAYDLAAIEDGFAEPSPRDHGLARSFAAVSDPIDIAPLGTVGSKTAAAGLGALASQKVVLPVADFLRWVFNGDSTKVAAYVDTVSGLLPGVFNRLIAAGLSGSDIRNSPFHPSPELASVKQRKWAADCAEKYAMTREAAEARILRATLNNRPAPKLRSGPSYFDKSSSATSEAQALAKSYALYKLAFLQAQPDEMPLTAYLAVQQNYIN